MTGPSDPGPGRIPYVTFDEWGPHCCDYPVRPIGQVSTIVIHHQGAPCSVDEASTVRGIENWGWNRDGARVEYGLLVGPYTGTVFQGYGVDYGAHCSSYNQSTFGICGMGDWTSTAPPAVLLDGLARAVAWYLERPGRVAKGWRIVGHKDLNTGTSCPARLYDYLDSIRAVAEELVRQTPPPEGDDMLLRQRWKGYHNQFLIGAGGAEHLTPETAAWFEGKGVEIITSEQHPQSLKSALFQTGLTADDLVPTGEVDPWYDDYA